MKKILQKVKVSAVAVLAAAIVSGSGAPVPVQAAKKLSVNRVYTTTTRVKGKTKKKYQVRIKIGKKTYKATASKKGNYSIKIPKQKPGKAYYVKAYRKKGKKWKYYTKKKFYVIASKIAVNNFKPSSKTITGYTRPKYKVKVTIGGKTYTVKASKTTGYFKVKLKQQAGSSKAAIKVYNTKGKTFTTAAKNHTHAWKKQYKTIYHPEVGHYEIVVVPAWDEKKQEEHWICYGCKLDLNVEYEKYKANWEERKKLYPDEDYCDTLSSFCTLHRYILNNGCTSSWHDELVDVIIHHEATTKQQWKVDKKAHDEKVVAGYKCDCGAKK